MATVEEIFMLFIFKKKKKKRYLSRRRLSGRPFNILCCWGEAIFPQNELSRLHIPVRLAGPWSMVTSQMTYEPSQSRMLAASSKLSIKRKSHLTGEFSFFLTHLVGKNSLTNFEVPLCIKISVHPALLTVFKSDLKPAVKETNLLS